MEWVWEVAIDHAMDRTSGGIRSPACPSFVDTGGRPPARHVVAAVALHLRHLPVPRLPRRAHLHGPASPDPAHITQGTEPGQAADTLPEAALQGD